MAISEPGQQDGIPRIHDGGAGNAIAYFAINAASDDPAVRKRYRPVDKRLQNVLIHKWVGWRVRDLGRDDRGH